MKFISIVKDVVSTRRGKIITAASVVVVACTIVFISMAGTSDGSLVTSVSGNTSSSALSDTGTFAAAPAINVPDSESSTTSSNPLSVVVGKPSLSTPKTSSTISKPSSNAAVSMPIKTTATLKSTNIPEATPPTPKSPSTATKTSSAVMPDPYSSYTTLDMTDFTIGPAVYYTNDENSIDTRFENMVYSSCNLPRNRMGSTVVDLQGPTLMYANGQITLNELRSVLLNGKKYIGGGNDKYIVTGVYDNSGITYDRDISTIDSNPDSVINGIYAKDFVNNPYAGTTSYCDGDLCVKVSDGGSKATIGYVRALVFTLKKLS